MCTGAAIGGVIATRLPEISGQSFLTLFLLSGILRGAVALFLLPRANKSSPGGEVAPSLLPVVTGELKGSPGLSASQGLKAFLSRFTD